MTGAPDIAGVPLVAPRAAADAFAWSGGTRRSVRDFLADVAALAERLPGRAHVVNLCADRYRFAVAFAAALVRGQVSLLPPSRAPEFLLRLAAQYPDLYCLADEAVGWCPLEVVRYPERLDPPAGEPAAPVLPAAQVAAIVFTSGTTGAPTPHVKLWGALARGAVAEARSLGLDRVPGATLVGTVPPQHMYGFESTVLLALQGRLALHDGRPFYPGDVRAALMAIPAPRVLVTTPVHLRALALDGTDLPPLELILSATAPLPSDTAAGAEARYGAPVREIFGFTEAGMVASRRTTEGPVWRLLPGVRLRADGDSFWAEGGHIPQPARFTDIVDVIDAERFVVSGRAADLVNVAGKRASLAGLNAELLAIPGVVDGAFYLPEAAGEGVARVAALVVAPGLNARRVLAELRRRIDPAFLPRPLHLVDRLPRNATGKISIESLRALAASRPRR
ncbi:MAG TPA: AMP-binding protein [Burkholderiales bacterium]|nr:AMP-binding protein [Burkholderiales bacterium]